MTPTAPLLSRASHANSRLQGIHQRLAFERQRAATIERKIAQIERDKAELVKAVALIDRAIEHISRNGIGTIETLVSNGMALAFQDETLSFHVVKTEGKRGNSYSFEGQRGEVRGQLDDSFGGGLSNVVGFLLRVIMIERFKLAKVLVLDEQFNNVYAGYLPMLSRLLRDLTRNHGFTILAVTHQKVLATAADNVYRVEPREGLPPELVKLTKEEMAHWEDESWRTLES